MFITVPNTLSILVNTLNIYNSVNYKYIQKYKGLALPKQQNKSFLHLPVYSKTKNNKSTT